MSTFLEITISNAPEFSEILMAELSSLNFDSFEETENGIKAYVEKDTFNATLLDEVKEQYEQLFTFTYQIGELEEKNWNEEWEKNFKFTEVDDKVLIRADFHQPDKSFPYEIVITPQMSFGTGHHNTTAGMIRIMLELDFKGKDVLDAGTGTGILAIMAKKLNCDYVYAYDIDRWSYNNCLDNFKLNNNPEIEIEQGDVSLLSKTGRKFDIVLANINKNVLLADIPEFTNQMKENGYLVLSGFYEKDVIDIDRLAQNNGLTLHKQSVSANKWTVLVFKRM